MTYTAAMVGRARQLAESGWTNAQISRMLGSEFGKQPHQSTVKAWVDPDEWERRRSATVASMRRVRARRAATSPVGFIDRTLLTLRCEDGLTYPTIEKVLRRFYRVEMGAYEIRLRLYELGVEKNPNKVRANQARAAA